MSENKFIPAPNFTSGSYKQICPVTNLGKQAPAYGNENGDPFVFRGPEITYHDGRGPCSLGTFDVRPQAIDDAARNYLYMHTKEEYDELRETYAAVDAAHFALEVENSNLRTRLDAMILAEAENIVNSKALEQELMNAYAELYGYDDSSDSDSEDVLDLPEDELIEFEAAIAEGL